MIEDFKDRHRTGRIKGELIARYRAAGLRLGANYPRYSDSNSQPKSIPDQVRLALPFAKAKEIFVPWELIVADSARSATHGTRRGFENLLKLIRNRSLKLAAVFIDDFQRGSRNESDSWKLAGICKNVGVGLYGVSDGFHIDDPDWDTKVRLLNMFNQMECKNKQQRVRRGLRGIATLNRATGRLPVGYGRQPIRDELGNVMRKVNGEVLYERAIDPATSAIVREAFDLFCNQKWSTYQIAMEFNRRQLDGGDSWSDGSIGCLLTNPAYIGLFIWGRTSKEYDWESQKYVTVSRPWTEWECYYDKGLAIVEKWQHVYARNKLVKRKQDPTRKPRKQPQRMAPTLLSGTLICGYCGKELQLCRSTPKYKSLGCLNGLFEKHSCQLKTSKSTTLLENAVLKFIDEALLTPDAMATLWEKANVFLAQERQRPQIDTRSLKARSGKLRAEINCLLGRIKGATISSVIEVYEQEIAKLKTELDELARKIAQANRSNEPPPQDLSPGLIEAYLCDMRGVLGQEVPAAAEAIRKLTGPITVTQEPHAHTRQGARWMLNFTPSLMPLLRDVSLRLGYPDSPTMEFLCMGKWTMPESVDIRLGSEGWHRSESTADTHRQVVKMLEVNLSVREIIEATGLSQTTVYRIKNRQKKGAP